MNEEEINQKDEEIREAQKSAFFAGSIIFISIGVVIGLTIGLIIWRGI